MTPLRRALWLAETNAWFGETKADWNVFGILQTTRTFACSAEKLQLRGQQRLVCHSDNKFSFQQLPIKTYCRQLQLRPTKACRKLPTFRLIL